MPQNAIEKIAQKFAVGLAEGQKVHAGDFISIRPAYVMTHDNTGAIIPKFKAIGASKFANPRQVVFTLDHNVQDTSEKNISKYKKIEEFAREMGNDFYPAGRGIGHQIMIEEGYAFPGTLVVASDSHSNMYGGIGALGTPIVRTDAAAIWATSVTWWQIPPVLKVELTGELRKGVSGKDVILALCGYFNNDEALNHVIEFTGEGVKHLTIDKRLTIANMTTEWGALGGVFPIDEITIGWLRQRADFITERGLQGVPSDDDGNGVHPRLNHFRINQLIEELPSLAPDENAFYAKEISIDLSGIEPYVAGPDTVKIATPASEIKKEKIKINKAYLVSCVNARVEDIAEAAKIIKGKKVAEGVEFYVGAASGEVEAESKKRGDWQALLEAGAIALPPGCGPCIGLGKGLLKSGEVGISATNRNFKGRMGSPEAKAYLASPAVVAASAVEGFITTPFETEKVKIQAKVKTNSARTKGQASVELIEGFPKIIEGNLIFCPSDNMNTDGIFPGKYTYIDDFTPEDQAKVVMENYDPQFVNVVKRGDILAGGFNFGTGSSREQAATALKYKGIRIVIAGSFSATYLRNAFNNGFLAVAVPEFVKRLKELFPSKSLTINTQENVVIDFENSVLRFAGEEFHFNPIGKAAQEIIVAGGLGDWVKGKI